LLNRRHRAELSLELKEAKKIMEAKRQLTLVDELNSDIIEMNASEVKENNRSKRFCRDDLMDDVNRWNDEESVGTNELDLFVESLDNTLDDVDVEPVCNEAFVDPDAPISISKAIANLDLQNEEFSSSRFHF
jgi:hypothetical protein